MYKWRRIQSVKEELTWNRDGRQLSDDFIYNTG